MGSKKLLQNEKVAYRVLEGSAVLVSPEDSLLYKLNPVATRIWELADGKNTIEAVSKVLSREFEVDQVTALRDTERMVREFKKNNLFSLSD